LPEIVRITGPDDRKRFIVEPVPAFHRIVLDRRELIHHVQSCVGDPGLSAHLQHSLERVAAAVERQTQCQVLPDIRSHQPKAHLLHSFGRAVELFPVTQSVEISIQHIDRNSIRIQCKHIRDGHRLQPFLGQIFFRRLLTLLP